MDEIVARIVTDLESQLPISQSFLKDLEALIEYTINSEDPIDHENLYNELSSRNLSLSSLTNAVSSAMDSGLGPITSILASKVYLLLLLSPDAPVFTIFSPIAFLSLLRAVRLAVKNPSLGSKEGDASLQTGRKKKGVRNQRRSRVENMDTEENEGEGGTLDVKDLFSVLEKLEKALNLVHLDRFPDCLKALVQTVCDMPITFEVQGNSNTHGRLYTLCSRILGESLKAEHGNQEDTAAEVLKAITPLILLSKSPARSFGLDFVVNRMVRIGESSNDVKKAVANLPKYLVCKAPERAEARALAVESIIDIVRCLDSEYQIGFADYVVKMSQGKGQFRLLSIDLIYALMMSLKGLLEFDMVDNIDKPSGLRLLEALIQRCSDSTAGIRARALTNLAQLVVSLSGNDKYRLSLKESMGYGNEGSNWMNNVLKSRCTDEKAAVRKASLSLLSKLTLLLGEEVDEELIKTVGMACSDPLVSIRKVAISALSEVFRTYSNCLVTKEWLHSVPRLINDNETTIQEECENLFSELVLERVSRAGSTSSENFDDVPYNSNNKKKGSNTGVLGLLKEMCDGEVSPWVKKICSSLGRKKKLKPKVAVALQNIIRSSESRWLNHCASMEKWTAPPGAWFLLSEVSPFLSKAIDWEFLLHHWQLLDKNQSVAKLQSPIEPMTDLNESNSVSWAGDRVFLLQTISSVSVELPPEPAADLAHNFLKRLEGFNMHSTEVNAHVKALRNLCKRKALHTEEADSLVTRWVNQLHSKASQVLDTYMSKISGATRSKETAFLTPLAGTSRNVTRTPDSVSKLLAQAIIGVYTIGSLVIVCPSADFKSIVPLIHTIITSGTSDPKSRKVPGPTSPTKKCAPSLYIQAWITMGKICLADGKLAKRYIPLFVQELEKSDCAALRNNIVVMMADFCVRYTALVDCYMSKITNCLRDPCELVRRQTFVLLARLLQRDYVKWRGVLFLRFLLCLVDESEEIRKLSDFLFGNILKAKAPLLAYNSFVEAIFVLNDCNAHTGRSNPNGPHNENRLFSIRGNDEKSRSQRMHTYTTLLKQMAPEHLLATFAKVCAEILAAASDGMLSLEDITGQSVLRDAFLILSSKEIRIQANRGASSDTGDIEEEVGDNPANASKGKVITQAVRKGLIQNTIPIFIELKRLLESKNSPLMGSLMDCLRILLKDYKTEIEDILVADQQLRKELLYDMEKHESIKATTKAAEAMQRSNTPCRSPKDLPQNVCEDTNVANAVADAVAAATVRSVLRDANHGILSPLSAMGVPKVKSRTCGTREGATPGNRPNAVIESLRRRQAFDSDEEN